MVSREVLFPDIKSEQVTDRCSLGGAGMGCFGKVYSAHYKPIGKVAVKYSLRRCHDGETEKEFDFLVKHGTSHPNIVHAFGLISDNEGIGLVMEYLPGGTLNDVMFRTDIIYTVENVFHWSLQIASAVAHMHAIGAIHRDLKPHNLLLDQSLTQLKLCDFGFARKVDPSMTVRTGSWYWMAPEVMVSNHYDFKCDVFGIGIIMWQLVAREFPYKELITLNEVEYVQKICNEGYRPRDLGCLPELQILMEWCWDKITVRIAADELRDQLYETLKIFDHGRLPPSTIISDKLLAPIGCYENEGHKIDSDSMQLSNDDVHDQRKKTLQRALSKRDSMKIQIPTKKHLPIEISEINGDVSRPRSLNMNKIWDVSDNRTKSYLDFPDLEPEPALETEQAATLKHPAPSLSTKHNNFKFKSFYRKITENLMVPENNNDIAKPPPPPLQNEIDCSDPDLTTTKSPCPIGSHHSAEVHAPLSRSESKGQDSSISESPLESSQCSLRDTGVDLSQSHVRFQSKIDLYSNCSLDSWQQTPFHETVLSTPIGHYSDQERILKAVNETYETEEVLNEKDLCEAEFLTTLERQKVLRQFEAISSQRSEKLDAKVNMFENSQQHSSPSKTQLVGQSNAPTGEDPRHRFIRSRRVDPATYRPVNQLRSLFEKKLN